jgi:hypothetical protein
MPSKAFPTRKVGASNCLNRSQSGRIRSVFSIGLSVFAIKLMQTNGFSFSAHFARIFRVAAGLLNGPMAARGDERNHKPQSSTA